MTLKAWREIARTHKDVLEGTFKQSEFAADTSQVASGNASPEYQDAKKFISRIFITEGMRLLLISVIQRLAGQGGDPVIQLQTAFGGGKTHTMLAVYHLATYRDSLDELCGIPSVLDEANIPSFHGAKVAVIDGKPGGTDPPTPTPTTLKTQFYGSINLDPLKSKIAFAEIVDEVVQQFTSKLNIDVRIAVEIEAQAPEGFDESLQRAIKENCSVLKFKSAEFESE